MSGRGGRTITRTSTTATKPAKRTKTPPLAVALPQVVEKTKVELEEEEVIPPIVPVSAKVPGALDPEVVETTTTTERLANGDTITKKTTRNRSTSPKRIPKTQKELQEEQEKELADLEGMIEGEEEELVKELVPPVLPPFIPAPLVAPACDGAVYTTSPANQMPTDTLLNDVLSGRGFVIREIYAMDNKVQYIKGNDSIGHTFVIEMDIIGQVCIKGNLVQIRSVPGTEIPAALKAGFSEVGMSYGVVIEQAEYISVVNHSPRGTIQEKSFVRVPLSPEMLAKFSQAGTIPGPVSATPYPLIRLSEFQTNPSSVMDGVSSSGRKFRTMKFAQLKPALESLALITTSIGNYRNLPLMLIQAQVELEASMDKIQALIAEVHARPAADQRSKLDSITNLEKEYRIRQDLYDALLLDAQILADGQRKLVELQSQMEQIQKNTVTRYQCLMNELAGRVLK